MELSSVIEMFAEFERELVPLSLDDVAGREGLGFKNILARESKEGVVVPLFVTSVFRRCSSSSPLGAEGFVGMGAGDETLVRLCVEPE